MAHGAILGQKLEDALLVDGSKSMQANLNMNNHKITNVTNGTSNADAVNYSQLQTKLSLSGGTMTGPINMGNNKITNVANAVNNTDAVNLRQMNSTLNNYATTAQLGNYLPLSGGTLNGQLNMNNSKITGLADGTKDTDAATVGQVNAAVASNVVAVFGHNDEQSGIVIGPTCLYVWKDSTLSSTSANFDSKYATINKWYNLSGLYNKGITELDLLAPSGTNTRKIGSVDISNSSLIVNITTTYCGFAYIQTFDYN